MKNQTGTLADVGVGVPLPLTAQARSLGHGFMVRASCLIRSLAGCRLGEKIDVITICAVLVAALLVTSVGFGALRLVGYVFSDDWHPEVWWFADWWWVGFVHLFS
jgi:hypothetical protein